MILSNAQQFSVLLWSLLFGVCLGVAYDVLRAFRVFVKCSAVPVFFQDLFYFLTAAVASFLFIFEVNDGTVRLFILMAFLLGGLAERFTVGIGILWLCRKIKKNFSAARKNATEPTHNNTQRLTCSESREYIAQKN